MSLPSLDNSSIGIGKIRSEARKQLVDAIDTRLGKKALVLDPKLSGPLTLLCEFSVLQEHGVDQMFRLEKTLPSEHRNVIYILKPHVESMRTVAEHIRERHRAKQQQGGVSVFFVPRRSTICERVLEEEGVYADITFGELPLDFIPYEEDVVSLELDTGLRECAVDGDTSSLHALAKALMRFQGLFGPVPHVKGVGSSARAVADMLARMRREQQAGGGGEAAGGTAGGGGAAVDVMFLMDRGVDFVTPLCTQVTYEGFVDEEFGIRDGKVEVEVEGSEASREGGEGSSSTGARKAKMYFNNSDMLVREYRDLNTSTMFPKLQARMKALQERYNKFKDKSRALQQMPTDEIKIFVGDLTKNLKSATQHVAIASRLSEIAASGAFRARWEVEAELVDGKGLEEAAEYLESLMGQGGPLVRVLRVLCLASLTHGGIPRKLYDTLRRELLQVYGYEHLETLGGLEAAGLLRQNNGERAVYPKLKQSLKLYTELAEIPEVPTDITFAYPTGYAALSVRLVQRALVGGWRAIEEVLKLLPGPHFEHVQGVGEGGVPVELPAAALPHLNGGTALVVFIGGVTFAEISALRWLAKEGEWDFIVATTKLINGNTLLQNLLEIK